MGIAARLGVGLGVGGEVGILLYRRNGRARAAWGHVEGGGAVGCGGVDGHDWV